MNRDGGMTWDEHVAQMQIDHAREREGKTVLDSALHPLVNESLSQYQAEVERLQAENARLREVAEAAREGKRYLIADDGTTYVEVPFHVDGCPVCGHGWAYHYDRCRYASPENPNEPCMCDKV